MGLHGGGGEGEAAEEPGRVEGASVAGWEGTRRSEKAKVSEEAVRRKGGEESISSQRVEEKSISSQRPPGAAVN